MEECCGESTEENRQWQTQVRSIHRRHLWQPSAQTAKGIVVEEDFTVNKTPWSSNGYQRRCLLSRKCCMCILQHRNRYFVVLVIRHDKHDSVWRTARDVNTFAHDRVPALGFQARQTPGHSAMRQWPTRLELDSGPLSSHDGETLAANLSRQKVASPVKTRRRGERQDSRTRWTFEVSLRFCTTSRQQQCNPDLCYRFCCTSHRRVSATSIPRW